MYFTINKTNFVLNMTFKFLYPFIKKHLFSLLCFLFFLVLFELVETICTQLFDRNLINTVSSEPIFFKLAVIFIFCYASCQNMHLIVDKIIAKFSFNSKNKIQNEIRNYLFNYTIDHSINYFNNSFSGAINNKINSIARNYGDLIEFIFFFIKTLFVTVFTQILYAKYNIYLGILFYLLMFMYFISLFNIRKKMKEKSRIISEEQSKYVGLINDAFVNTLNIKTYSRELYEQNMVNKQILKILRVEIDFLKLRSKFLMVNFFMAFILLFSVISFGGILLAQHKILLGDFMFITVIISIFRFILDESGKKLINYSVCVGRIENNLKSILQPIEIKNKTNNKINVNNGKIELKNITFKYNN